MLTITGVNLERKPAYLKIRLLNSNEFSNINKFVVGCSSRIKSEQYLTNSAAEVRGISAQSNNVVNSRVAVYMTIGAPALF